MGGQVYNGTGIWRPSSLTLTAAVNSPTVNPIPSTPNSSTQLIDPNSQAVLLTTKVIKLLSQTPNIMAIVKSIKPVLFAIEEYSYFLLLTQKNSQTALFYEFCFNSTWHKWEPDYIANIPSMHTPRFNGLASNDYNHTPSTLKERS
mgnify:FL=1